MTDEERQTINDGVHHSHDLRLSALEKRVGAVETRMAAMDTQFAVINTKLSAILWGVGVIGTALIGVLVKIVFGG